MAANDAQKQSLLDQITAAATAAPQPAPDALVSKLPPLSTTPTGPDQPAITPLADQTADSTGSVANLEDQASRSTQTAPVAVKTAEGKPGFLTKLKNFAGGAFGLEDPESNPAAAAGAKVMGLASRVGTGLAEAAGTPEQKQIAEENAQTPLKLAQLQNEQQYRNALIGTKNAANDINQQKADQQKVAADARMRLKGYVPDEQQPGAYKSMNEDQILADPILSQNTQLARAAAASKNAGAALADARREAMLTHDESLWLKAKQIENQYKLAQAHLKIQLHNLDRQDFQDLQNFGGDVNGRTLTPENAIPGTPLDENGQPVATKNRTAVLPTTQVRNIGAQATAARAGMDKTISELQDPTFASKLGIVKGRWNEFAQGKIGVNDPDMSGLQTDLIMTSTAIALAHARGRLPENLREEFDRMINAPEQTPENIISTLEHIKPYMKNLEDRAAIKTKSTGNTPSGGTKLTPAEYLAQKNKKASQ